MKEMDEIWYKGIAYPVRWLDVGRYKKVLVAPLALEDAIIHKETGRYNTGGESVDDQIWYYCNEEEWTIEEDKELIQAIKKGM